MTGEPTGGVGSAAERYKQITGRVAELVERAARADRERAVVLEQEIEQAWHRLVEASERERVVRVIAETQWEAAIAALWDERWLKVRPLPRPEELPPVDVAASGCGYDLNELDLRIEQAFQALEEALRRRSLFRLRR